MFKVNEGPMDRLARAIVGVVLLFLALATSGGLQILLFVLAAICLLTAVTGFCSIYALFKINTTKKTLTTNEEPKDLSSEASAKEEETKEEPKVNEEAEAKEEEVKEDLSSEASAKEDTANVMSEPELIPKEDPETIIKPEESIEIETPEASNQPHVMSSAEEENLSSETSLPADEAGAQEEEKPILL